MSHDTDGLLFKLPSDAFTPSPDDCYTPKWVFDAMGVRFDLDVAAPPSGPLHVPADRFLSPLDDGLACEWGGTIWCNPPYSNFGPWARKWASHPSGALMGTYTPGTSWTPVVFAAADVVSLITCEFVRPHDKPIRPMHGLFVAFRGMGLEPAERLANADRFGSVLYGRRVA